MAVLRPIAPHNRNADYILKYAYIPIMLLGFYGMAKLYDRRNRILAFMALGYLISIIAVSIFKLRYRLMIAPILIMYASMYLGQALRPSTLAFFRKSRPGRIPAPSRDPAEDDACAPLDGRSLEVQLPGIRPPRAESARRTVFLIALFCVALAIRLLVPLVHGAPRAPGFIEMESQSVLSERLDRGTPPVYPLFLGAIRGIAGDRAPLAVLLVQGMIGSLVVILLYATATRLGNRRAGLVAAAAGAVYPAFIASNMHAGTESLIVVIVASLMAIAASRIDPGRKAAISGALLALGVLTAPVLVCLAPGILMTTKRRRMFLLVFMLALTPYTVRNAVKYQKAEPVYELRSYKVDLSLYTSSRDAWDAVDGAYRNASVMLGKVWNGGEPVDAGSDRRNAEQPAAAYGYAMLALFGAVGLARKRRKEHREVVLPVMLAMAILLLFSTFRTDFRTILEPVLILYASMLGGKT